MEIKIDENCTETRIVIVANKMTDEVSALMQRLVDESPQVIAGFRNDTAEFLDTTEIIRVYATDGKVYAVTHNGEYRIKMRLYEIEDRLDARIFVKISNSEIVNLKKVRKVDLSLVGTICVSLSDGTITYASRRYVSKIRQTLGI